jgi:uncharacterized protein
VIVAIVADTHLPKGSRRLPEACIEHLQSADLILHAGDVASVAAFEELCALGPPVRAVHGNVDEPALARSLPDALELDLEGVRIAIIHDAGPARGRLRRMRARFPEARAVVFGHSHLPLHQMSEDGFQIFNPGSPTDRRRAPEHTIGLARVLAGGAVFEHVPV